MSLTDDQRFYIVKRLAALDSYQDIIVASRVAWPKHKALTIEEIAAIDPRTAIVPDAALKAVFEASRAELAQQIAANPLSHIPFSERNLWLYQMHKVEEGLRARGVATTHIMQMIADRSFAAPDAKEAAAAPSITRIERVIVDPAA